MALVLADRVRDTTTTTGTGTVTLSGTAPTGYQTFGAAIGNGNTTYYTINAGSQWEVGLGTYSSTGPTLARTTVLASSNGGSLVDFSTGTKDVFVTYPAEEAVYQDGSAIKAGTSILGVANGGTGATTLGANGVLLGNGTSAISATAVGSTGQVLVGNTGGAPTWATLSGIGVTSFSAGTTGLTPASATTGAITLAGTLNVANGGTGATSLTSGYLVKGNGTSAASASVVYDDGTNVGIGTSSPVTRLTIDGGAASLRTGNQFRFYPTANNNYSQIYNPTGGQMAFDSGAGEAMRIDGSGNVGIGTTGPLGRLDVREANRADSTNIANVGVYTTTAQSTGVGGTLALGGLFNGSDLAPFASIRGGKQNSINNNYDGYLALQTIANGGTLTERMRIDSTGRLGIGTNNPTELLTLNGVGANAGYPLITFNDQGTNRGQIGYTFDFGYFHVSSASTLAFRTAGSERMRIDGSGNVGIGTSSPLAKLDVVGQGLFQGSTQTAYRGANIGALNINNNSADGTVDFTQGLVFTDNSNNTGAWAHAGIVATGSTGFRGNLVFGTDNDGTQANAITERMRIDSSGNVGIGTSTPSDKLEVNGGAASTYLKVVGQSSTAYFGQDTVGLAVYQAANKPIYFVTNNAERARIDSSGNLLVGTTTAPVSGVSGVQLAPLFVRIGASSTANTGLLSFNNPNGEVGLVTVSGTATAYNTSSDYRLKEIDGPVANSGAYIDALKPVQGSWKADGSRFIGLLAHEVQEVSETPIATGEKDGEKMQAMDYSAPELIANLIAEIQSLRARVAQLEGN